MSDKARERLIADLIEHRITGHVGDDVEKLIEWTQSLEQQLADLQEALTQANMIADTRLREWNKANERIIELEGQLNKVHSTTDDGYCHFCNRYHLKAKP